MCPRTDVAVGGLAMQGPYEEIQCHQERIPSVISVRNWLQVIYSTRISKIHKRIHAIYHVFMDLNCIIHMFHNQHYVMYVGEQLGSVRAVLCMNYNTQYLSLQKNTTVRFIMTNTQSLDGECNQKYNE